MKCGVVLLLTIKTIYGFGLFQSSMMPFHMQFEIPALSSMNAMPFPAIFNPLEVMPRGTEEPEARGMDAGGPMGNITSSNKTEIKDGFKVTTITSNGPGFHSYIKEFKKEGNATGNGTAGPSGFDMAKMMGGSSLFSLMQQLRNAGRPKERKCKKCGKGKFCDPIFHLCRKKFSEGRTCMFQKQCGKRLKCQWGKCQKAKAGDPGTFCKANSVCNGDACCRNTPGAFHLMCIPRQAEGSICGLKKDTFADVLYVVKRSTAPTCSPCQKGLKCADTGDPDYKQCVKKAYVERAADEMEDDNPSNALDDDKDQDDEKSGSGSGEAPPPDPLQGRPPKGKPNTADKNPIKEKSDDNKWEPPPPETPEDEDDDEEEGDDDENDSENEKDDKKKKEKKKEEENALDKVDPGIAVQKPPKTGKKGGKKDKSKGKSK